MKHLGDITKISGAEIEPVDCITFGSPCQDLSVAGTRNGLAGERSGLFMEAVRIIKEMRIETNGMYPTFAIWENVPGAFSSNGGEDFRTVLEELARCAKPDVCIPRHEKGRWAKSGFVAGDDWSLAWRLFDAQYWGVPQRRKRIALVMDFGGQRAGEILFERQGVSGHSEPSIPAWKGVARDPADHSGAANQPTFCIQGSAIGRSDRNGPMGSGINQNVAYTINCVDRHGVAFTIDNVTTPKVGANIAYTLKQQDYKSPPVVFDVRSNGHKMLGDTAGAVISHYGTGGQNTPIVCEEESRNCGFLARFLTPVECERLQGFPDGWTEIGEWTDSNGKKHSTSDSKRYKALGNSIALPQWWWLICKMAAFLPERATLGSLFDGIGGFPLVWETRYGKGTAIWASEIESFPIAVTKKRFPEEEE